MKYRVGKNVQVITIRIWDGQQFTPSIFFDEETWFGSEKDADGNPIITEDRFEEIVAYWQKEVDKANEGEPTKYFGNWREEHALPLSLFLYASNE